MTLYDATTRTALASGKVVLRYFLYIHGKDDVGDPMTFGFWNGEDNISASTVGALDGVTESRDYIGGKTLTDVDTIPTVIGLEVRSINVKLSQIQSDVQDMVRAYDIRHADAEVHFGLFSPTTGAVISTLFPLFLGKVDGAPIETPAVGEEGSISLKLVSNTVELTRTNPALKSDSTQQLRSVDRFRRYTDTARIDNIWWGEKAGGS